MKNIKGKYLHYKNKEYEVVGKMYDVNSEKWKVLYRALYDFDDLEGKETLFVRDWEEFFEEVDVDGKKVKRFKKIN